MAIEDRMMVLWPESECAVKPPDQQFPILAAPQCGFFGLEANNQALDRSGNWLA